MRKRRSFVVFCAVLFLAVLTVVICAKDARRWLFYSRLFETSNLYYFDAFDGAATIVGMRRRFSSDSYRLQVLDNAGRELAFLGASSSAFEEGEEEDVWTFDEYVVVVRDGEYILSQSD